MGQRTIKIEAIIAEREAHCLYNDTDQQRPFILKGDTLIIGDIKTWKRVLVKVD